MKILEIIPDGWDCTLQECRPGLFLSDLESLCVKTDYRDDNGRTQAFICDGGSFFIGVNIIGNEARERQIVTPVKEIWREV